MTATSLLGAILAPVARVGHEGVILEATRAFDARIGSGGGPVSFRPTGTGGVVFAADGQHIRVQVLPLGDGDVLAWIADDEPASATRALAASVATRIDRIHETLVSTVADGLREGRVEMSQDHLVELLASCDQLRGLHWEMRAAAGLPGRDRVPVCLATLAGECARMAFPGAAPVVERDGGDFTVRLERESVLVSLVALMRAMAVGGPPALRVRAGDGVRLDVVAPRALDSSRPDAVAGMRRLVGAHGGRIVIDEGLTVCIWLPAFSEGRVGDAWGTALVVDDDGAALALMAAVLRREGFKVLEADNGVGASALLRQHSDEIVVVVADAVLPGRSGLELAREARTAEPSIPTLIVTGHPGDLLDAGDGAGGLLEKPFGAGDLAVRVRELTGLSRRS